MKKHSCIAAIAAIVLALVGSNAGRAQAPEGTVAADGQPSASQRLHQLFTDRFRWEMEHYPESAMSRGDYTHADRITDSSLAAIQKRHDDTVEQLHLLQSIDKQSLDETDRVNYELFELELQRSVDGYQFRTFLAPIGSRGGPQQDIPQMADRVRFAGVQDYVNYIQRLRQVPQLIDDAIERMRLGLKEGRTPSKVTLAGVPGQFRALVEGAGLHALADPFNRMPAHIADDQKKELRERFEKEVFPPVRESVAKLMKFFEMEYLPHCRDTIAASDWPDGEAYYNFQLHTMTTTNLTVREIHELGMHEVARIKAEMMQVIRRSDFMSLHPDASRLSDEELFKKFIEYLRTDKRFYYDDPQALLAGYRDICKQVDAGLPKFFKTLPRLPYGVKEIPRFMAPTQTTAYYQSGDIRNAEPGYFMANTYALDQRPKYEMISLAMHEAVPGHHLQVALAQEMQNQPEFRKDTWFTAFGEGWALYSERLGIDMGLFNDPYNDFGRLLYEMWRACRLVVDPGMHALGWPREKAVQFMLDNTALSELNINNEIDRYINWPGQATGYKIGELKIRELRDRAEKTLGAKFDIREFHDVILGAGSVPLPVMERRVNEWIQASTLPQAAR